MRRAASCAAAAAARCCGGFRGLRPMRNHDRDVMKNADYIIDMGPGGGRDGGMIVATGSVEEIKNNIKSITGKYL